MTENFSTLHIIRERTSTFEESLQRMMFVFHEKKINTDIDWEAGSETIGIPLIDADEFDLMRLNHDLSFNRPVLDALVGELRTRMPDTASQSLSIPVRTYDLVANANNDRLFITTPEDERIRHEREVAKVVIEEYFGMKGRSRSWRNLHRVGRIPIISTTNMQIAHRALALLDDSPELLPQTVPFAPAKIVILGNRSTT